MIFLAEIPGQLLFFVIFAAVGVINWWLEKKKKEREMGDAPPPAQPRRPAGTGGGSGSDSEEERLRRFLEALGVPQPRVQQPPAPKPRPQAPAPQPRQPQRTFVQKMERRMPATKAPQKVLPKPKRQVIREAEEFPEAGRIEEAASSIERIATEFENMNVRVTVPPMTPLERPEQLVRPEPAAGQKPSRRVTANAGAIRALLRNRNSVRTAFIAAELLGKPRGLQG